MNRVRCEKEAGERGKDSNMSEKKQDGLRAAQIALLYIGCLMGAGFASGKEMWQFFGVFGGKGFLGILLATVIFVGFGYLSVSNARMLGTSDLSKMVSPVEHRGIENFVGTVMCLFLLMAYFSMLAAGGALLETQFGLPHEAGSLIYMLMAVLTAIRGFQSVSSRISKVTPVLVGGTLIIGLYMIVRDHSLIAEHAGQTYVADASPLASNWMTAAIAFVAYNLTAAIPMLGNCSISARGEKTARNGAVLGGAALGVCCLILYLATLSAPEAAAAADLPMIRFCNDISPVLRTVYAMFLLIAIFATCTSCFYGFTTKLPDRNYRLFVIWAVALAGYGLSLFGFSNLVAVVYPIGGYFSLIFLISMIVNFALLKKGKRRLPDTAPLRQTSQAQAGTEAAQEGTDENKRTGGK